MASKPLDRVTTLWTHWPSGLRVGLQVLLDLTRLLDILPVGLLHGSVILWARVSDVPRPEKETQYQTLLDDIPTSLER